MLIITLPNTYYKQSGPLHSSILCGLYGPEDLAIVKRQYRSVGLNGLRLTTYNRILYISLCSAPGMNIVEQSIKLFNIVLLL